MKTTIAAYKSGVAALHNLMDMLHVTLVDVMPSVELARAGGYPWRGYVIRNYQKQLAYGHYFCQIYLSEPTVILMEEFYNYSGMYYPWRVNLDLLSTPFFASNKDGQKAILVDFYQEALREALEWQVSAKRRSILPEKMLMDQEYITNAHFELPTLTHRVSNEYVAATKQQESIISLLRKIIEKELINAGLKKPYFKTNINGWNYRGVWMKPRLSEPEDVIPEGSFPFKFKIDLYDHPEYLRFESGGLNQVLDLESCYYFTLDESNQNRTLKEFLNPIIRHMMESIG